LLQESPADPHFDLASWSQQWDAIEAELIKAIDRVDDIAEGRRLMTVYLLDTNHLSPLMTLSHPLRHLLCQYC